MLLKEVFSRGNGGGGAQLNTVHNPSCGEYVAVNH